jgi:hypothetical protein
MRKIRRRTAKALPEDVPDGGGRRGEDGRLR